jgi:cytochrome b561
VLQLAAKGVHYLLYGLPGVMVLAGVALAWVRGDSLFNVFSIPSFAPGDKALAEQVGDFHETVGWVILAVAGVHAGAALAHRFWLRDGVLGRMLTR